MAGDLTGIAIEYTRRGLCILPVAPQGKKPLLRTWEKYTRERPPEDMVRSWFTSLDGVGIGAVTGSISGIVVIDIDTRSGMGYEQITDKYPTGLIARTGSGGFHLYYKHPGFDVKNRVDIIPGVDIRADGGFVVLPPTVSSSGRSYEWIATGSPGEYPEEFFQQDTADNAPEGEKWISEALRGVGAGQRNGTCARLAGYLLSKAMPVDVVLSILQEWNEKNDPPMELKELETTVQSVYRRDFRNKKPTTNKIKLEQDAEAVFDLVSMTQYFREYGQEGMQWSVDDWLPEDSIVFLVSPPESYKTWVLLDLAVSIASGKPFLDEYKVNKTGPVIIIQQEDSHAGITERMSVIIQGKMDMHAEMKEEESVMPCLPDLPIYLHPSRNLRFDNTKVMDELEIQIKKLHPVCVIIDPLYSATSTDNYMANATEDMFRLKKFRDEYGCSFIIAHHSKKNTDPDSTSREDSWGSQFLNAFLETGWQIRRNQKLPDNEVVVRRHSKTMGNMGMISLAFDISTKHPMKYAVASRPYTPAIADKSPAKGLIYELIMGEAMTASEVAGKTGKHKSTVSRQLKQLETANMIKKMPNGKYIVIDEE